MLALGIKQRRLIVRVLVVGELGLEPGQDRRVRVLPDDLALAVAVRPGGDQGTVGVKASVVGTPYNCSQPSSKNLRYLTRGALPLGKNDGTSSATVPKTRLTNQRAISS